MCKHTLAELLMYLQLLAELLVYLQLHKPVIIALVEILPKNFRYTVDENEFALDGYTLFHNLNARGRGIALYVHCSLRVNEVHFPNQDSVQKEILLICNSL